MKTANLVNRLFTLGILFLLAAFVLLTPVAARGVIGGQATFCLGFVLLFGYYLARLLETVRLPSITSYILVGILCGPFVLNLLSTGVVRSLQLFDDAALAIIALIAGGEMRLAVLKARKGAFASVITAQTLFSFLGAVGVVYLLRGQLSWLPVESWRGLLAVGLLLGLVTVARSPSTTIGVVTETRSKGPMTEVLVGVTVLLDVVVLVLAAFIVPASETLAVEGHSFSLAFAKSLVWGVTGSVAIGSVFGIIVAFYIRWLGRYLPVFLIGIGLVGSGLCRYYHFEPLLSFMIAGFIVENYSTHGQRLIRGLEKSAFPVYVIFFAISGAAIDMGALRKMWMLALVLVVMRGAAFYLSTLGASRLVRDLRPYGHGMWSGFLSQAGVTIGIATLIERRFDWGGDLKTIVLAMVAINQLIGPVALKFLLERKKEAGGMDRP